MRRKPSAPGSGVFLAAALLKRALRQSGMHRVLAGDRSIILVTNVAPESVDIVLDAAVDVLAPGHPPFLPGGVRVLDWTGTKVPKPEKLISEVLEASHVEKHVVGLFDNPETIPDPLACVVDAIVALGRPDLPLIQAMFRLNVGQLPGADITSLALVLPLQTIGVAVRKGMTLRHASDSIRRLHALTLAAAIEPETPSGGSLPDGPRLADLSGLGEAGEWGRSLADDLADYRAGTIGWGEIDRGAVVFGPPGTGKTTFALALGRSCDLPVHVHSLAAWQAAGYLDSMLKAMRKAFQDARETAPCILFIDELDGIGDRTDRSDHNSNYTRQVINCLLECLDGAIDREGVVVIGATNHPDAIDPAVRRPGRLDRHLEIPLPDQDARAGILRHHLGSLVPDLNLASIAAKLEGASGADIELLVRDAKRSARRDGRRPLEENDLACLLPPTVRLSEEAFRRVCVHEAGHYVVGHELAEISGCRPIVASANREVAGPTTGNTIFERRVGFDRTCESLVAEIVVLLAGTAAEEVLLGSRGCGAGGKHGASDLKTATEIAIRLEANYGMGAALTYLSADKGMERDALIASIPEMRAAVTKRLHDALESAKSIVGRRLEDIERVAAELSNCQGSVPGATTSLSTSLRSEVTSAPESVAMSAFVLSQAEEVDPATNGIDLSKRC